MALFLFTGEQEISSLIVEPRVQQLRAGHEDGFVVFVDSNNESQSGTKLVEKTVSDYVMVSAQDTADALLVVKQLLDERKIMEANFIIPQGNLKGCEDVKGLVFPPACKITVESLATLKEWKMIPENSDFSALLRKRLSELPTNDVVQTVQSKMIPSDIFIHGYSKRFGGISAYPGMNSLNLVYSLRKPDSLLTVKENARRLCSYLGVDPTKYNLAKANHGNTIWVYEDTQPETYDGIITKTQGVTVASPAADCNMLLLADPIRKVCGAIHAGWKGILAGIVEVAVKTMVTTYQCNPGDIVASIGPSLSVCCCEFGVEDSKKFLKIGEDVVVWFEGKEKPHLDLRLATRILLEKSGVKSEKIDDGLRGSDSTPDIAVCTKCDFKKEFFSYRRDGAKFGNQAAFISIK